MNIITGNEGREKCAKVIPQEIHPYIDEYTFRKNRLYNCRACVVEVATGKLLCSYNTYVAFIDSNGIGYDFLRLVYGYTSTSAQHINKFFHKFGVSVVYRAY